jgi:hypothetical protein
VPGGWPEAVRPPGGEDFEASAVAFPIMFICSPVPLGRSGLCLVEAPRCLPGDWRRQGMSRMAVYG